MSLYYEASALLTAPNSLNGSFKSRIFNRQAGKSSAAQIYALITEVSKWSAILKDVIDLAGILALEPKLTPILSLLLVHDLLLSKTGIAAPEKHVLREAVERHKARLRAEFTKVRLGRKCATIEELKMKIEDEVGQVGPKTKQPRWIRINTALTSLKEQLERVFKDHTSVSLQQVQSAKSKEKVFHVDAHIPDLLALPRGGNYGRSPEYLKGWFMLQDKASCFPAYLLLGSIPRGKRIGDIIDACAAPGNKTTHLAALLSPSSSHTLTATTTSSPRIYAVERDLKRSESLWDTVSRTKDSKMITILPGQDFLALEPQDARFANVTAILLDPSCSGSGILGREDTPSLSLPSDPRKPDPSNEDETDDHPRPKRRKKSSNVGSNRPKKGGAWAPPRAEAISEIAPDPSRLLSLSNLQTHLLTQAFSFPAATHITYSTCSLHHIENENVAARALASGVARATGWRVITRKEQPEGLRNWPCRGIKATEEEGVNGELELSKVDREACLRCWPDGRATSEGKGGGNGQAGTGGTMGFFVVGFAREKGVSFVRNEGASTAKKGISDTRNGGAGGDDDTSAPHGADDEEEWEGFVD